MNAKLRWLLEYWFKDEYHQRLVAKAINSDKVSLEDFISGFDAIRNAQWDENADGFIPDEFEDL